MESEHILDHFGLDDWSLHCHWRPLLCYLHRSIADCGAVGWRLHPRRKGLGGCSRPRRTAGFLGRRLLSYGTIQGEVGEGYGMLGRRNGRLVHSYMLMYVFGSSIYRYYAVAPCQ